MSARLKIFLKPKERFFVNGAVLMADRKVTLELLNDVVFLLESHVIQPEEADTPLRQLYFIVQSMLMEPKTMQMARELYENSHRMLLMTFKNQDVLEGLVAAKASVDAGRPFDALKKIRALFKLEAEILASGNAAGLPLKPAVA
jgi:flagellar protein FlbT